MQNSADEKNLPPLAQAVPSERDVIIFDFDGTLADTLPSICRVATKVLRDFGVPEERLVDVPQLVGPPFPQAFSLVFGLSADEAAQVTEDYRQIYNHLGASAWPAFPGIRDMLLELRAAGKRLAIASSKRHPFVISCATDAGIADCFELIHGKKSDGPGAGPKAQLVAAVLDDLGVTADDAVMVGDRYFDVEAAAENGVPCVGVLFGKTATREELEGAGACRVVDTVEELGHVLLGQTR